MDKKKDKSITKYYFSSKPLLNSLPPTDLMLFKKHLKLIRIKKGRELFQEGSRPKGVYILKRGKVKLYHRTQTGSEQIIYIYTQGEMFGYRPLLCQDSHPASAKAIEECGIYFLSAEKFLEMLSKSMVLSNLLLQNLSHEFTVLVNHIASFSQKTTRERIALSLLILQEKYRKSGQDQVEIALSRSDLASFAGTTQETVARAISRFKSEDVLQIKGRKIIITNEDALHVLIE